MATTIGSTEWTGYAIFGLNEGLMNAWLFGQTFVAPENSLTQLQFRTWEVQGVVDYRVVVAEYSITGDTVTLGTALYVSPIYTLPSDPQVITIPAPSVQLDP